MRYKYSWELIGFGKYQEVKTEIKEPRENGFYWVRYQGSWMVADWCPQGWTFLADTSFVGDAFFDKIHEERIEEPWYN